MTRRHKNKTPGKKLRSLYLWHRWIGLTAAAFVILLSITGLALNHTEGMLLDSRYVRSPTLLDWYGIRAPEDIASFRAGPVTVSSIGKQVYINTSVMPNIAPPLIGAVAIDEYIIVALRDTLLLLTVDGELVEQMGNAAGVPVDISAVGISTDNRLLIRSGSGFHATDSQMIRWEKTEPADAAWADPVTPSKELVAELQESYRGNGLSAERVMLDLHSGRILGQWGVYLMDGAAIVFLLLAISGMWLWGKRRTSARAHRRRLHSHNPPQRP